MAEDFRWSVRVNAGATGEAARVFIRKQQIAIGAPISVDDQYPDATALECALGALGAELVNGLRLRAKRARIDLDGVEAVVKANLEDELAALDVMGADGSPGLREISVKVYASCPEEEALQKVWDGMLERLPLLATFRKSAKLELSLKIAP